MVQKLNEEQKELFYHVLHLIKTSHKPFYCYLSGGTGFGKSHEVKVLMLAPAGKAAYNVKGNTIHSALSIPACQSLKNYKPLDSSRLNTLRCQLGAVKLIFLVYFLIFL